MLPLLLAGCGSGAFKQDAPDVVVVDTRDEQKTKPEPAVGESDSMPEPVDKPVQSTKDKSEPSAGPAIELSLTPEQLRWVGTQIYLNECSGQFRCLVHWNENEAFPSLGIGHFIWYPQGVDEPFVESFPALIDFMADHGTDIPGWLQQLEPFDAPWPDRPAFARAESGGQVQALRDFLSATRGQQVRFIFQRAGASLSDVLERAPEGDRERLTGYLQALAATPGGTYALMDYVNFKGEGLAESERYQGEGWGLLQVLLAMNPKPGQPALDAFREAAGQVLTRRAQNAENSVERERWLQGWLVRLETYREPPQAPLL
ncbi:MAG: hypothetical protein HLX50_11750 [Alteromonadaceae bacterium]|nr:hypothetical protein [Alteromonadaceae bacterium]